MLYEVITGLSPVPPEGDDEYLRAFHAAMNDDFNTPEALAVLFEIAREINRSREAAPERAGALAGRLVSLGAVLGLLESYNFV